MPNWTPGPWRARGVDIPTLILAGGEDCAGQTGSLLIASVQERSVGWDFENNRICHDPEQATVTRQNAALIAAAPDLYEALESIVKQLPTWVTEPYPNSLLEKAVAALAKARGENPNAR